MNAAPPPVSLVIVNTGRREELARVLLSLRYQRYPNFEVIVVTDAAEAERPSALIPVRWVPFAERNISAARNRGIALARGEIVAFCDDDAVPEFGWLESLVPAFATPDVGAAGGFTRGRNGVSFQWRAVEVDLMGRDTPLQHGPEPRVHPPAAGRFVKTVGTNCAFRMQALRTVGGFDEAFRFFLDETDLNLRLSQAGWATAVVPGAEVHHGFAASAQRTDQRVPLTLFEIGASLGYFLARHAPAQGRGARMEEFRAEQNARLERHFLTGQLGAADMRRLRSELEDGFTAGARRECDIPSIAPPEGAFEPVRPARSGRRQLIIAGPGTTRARKALAAEAAAAGDEVTFIDLELSHRNLVVRFTGNGYFYHRLGLWGKSLRTAPRTIRTPGARISAEVARVSRLRGPFLP